MAAPVRGFTNHPFPNQGEAQQRVADEEAVRGARGHEAATGFAIFELATA
jgi:hypothetical protein